MKQISQKNVKVSDLDLWLLCSIYEVFVDVHPEREEDQVTEAVSMLKRLRGPVFTHTHEIFMDDDTFVSYYDRVAEALRHLGVHKDTIEWYRHCSIAKESYNKELFCKVDKILDSVEKLVEQSQSHTVNYEVATSQDYQLVGASSGRGFYGPLFTGSPKIGIIKNNYISNYVSTSKEGQAVQTGQVVHDEDEDQEEFDNDWLNLTDKSKK